MLKNEKKESSLSYLIKESNKNINIHLFFSLQQVLLLSFHLSINQSASFHQYLTLSPIHLSSLPWRVILQSASNPVIFRKICQTVPASLSGLRKSTLAHIVFSGAERFFLVPYSPTHGFLHGVKSLCHPVCPRREVALQL